MSALTHEQIARWKHDGFLSPFQLLNTTELQERRDGLERFEKWLGAPVNEISASEDLKWRTMPYLVLPWASKLAHDPRILDVVQDLIGPDILIFTSTFFIKEPHSPTIAAWHQDCTYYGLEPKDEFTVWVALSDANEAAGCMGALSFRGKPRQLSHVSRAVKNSVNRASQVITEPLDEGIPVAMPLDEGIPVAMPLAAGSFSTHHGLCPHRSGTNTANHRRIGVGLNFIPTLVRPAGSIKTAAMLVRGVDRHHHFERVEPPQTELGAQSVATHERATTLYRNCYLEKEARHARLSA